MSRQHETGQPPEYPQRRSFLKASGAWVSVKCQRRTFSARESLGLKHNPTSLC